MTEQQKIWDEAIARDSRNPLGAQLRSAESRAKFLAESRDIAQVAEYLGKTQATIRSNTRDQKLASFIDEGKRRYPAWQFSQGLVVPGLEKILPLLQETTSPRAIAGFFTNDQSFDLFLDGARVSPVTWLWAGGDPGKVAVLARHAGIGP